MEEFQNLSLEENTKDKSKKFLYSCPHSECQEKFKTNSLLNFHIKTCSHKPKTVRCHWYIENNRRCRNRGIYGGYCFLHNIDYTYDPNGIKDSDGCQEPCCNTYSEMYIPNSIKSLKNMFVSNLTFKYKSKEYTIEQVHDTYAIFKTKDLVGEEITVWDSREDRKDKKGPLVGRFVATMEIECEGDAVVLVDDEYLCGGCFVREYNTSLKSLRKK